jgi:hypothetical protein
MAEAWRHATGPTDLPWPRRFLLNRAADPSGVSGLGIVATGCLFPDGSCVLRWHRSVGSTVLYDTIEDLLAVHGHGGATTVQFLDSAEPADFADDPESPSHALSISRPDGRSAR